MTQDNGATVDTGKLDLSQVAIPASQGSAGHPPAIRQIGRLDLLAEMLRAWDYTPARQLAAIIELLQDAAANGLATEAVATFKQEMKPEEGVTVFEAVRHTRREWDL